MSLHATISKQRASNLATADFTLLRMAYTSQPIVLHKDPLNLDSPTFFRHF